MLDDAVPLLQTLVLVERQRLVVVRDAGQRHVLAVPLAGPVLDPRQ